MAKNRKTFFVAMTLLVIVVCMTTLAVFSGFHHSTGKYGSMLLSVIVVFMLHFLVGDPILFILLSIADTFWPVRPLKFATAAEVGHQTQIDYLKLRMKSLRAHLRIPEKYRDEKLNGKYRQMVHDLWLYGWYFVFLVWMVGELHAKSAYYNKTNVEQLFKYNHSSYYGLNEVHDLSDAYDFIVSSLINAFHPETANGTSAPLWVHAEQAQLLGVVRLRQLRTTDWRDRPEDPPLSAKKHLPGWAIPYEHLPYETVYWHIYRPWTPHGTKDAPENKVNDENVAIVRSSTESSGYVAYLARKKQHSLDVVEYLRENQWLNYNTSALFMEFSFYSTDANLLTMCTLRVDQTPFGGVIPHVRIKSFNVVEHFKNLSISQAILIVGYMIVFVQFLKALTLKFWFEPRSIRKIWDKVDVVIVLLNVLIVILFIMQDQKLSKMLKQLELAPKSEYVHVHDVAVIDEYIRMFFGLLLCITTLRLWKALQISTISHLFTYTLSLAWKSVASVAIAIFIFILGFGLTVCTINGNSSLNLSSFAKSIVTCTCYAFGFGISVNINNFFYGGRIVGCILFAILVLVITIILINLFVSLINDNFSTAKDQVAVAAVVRRISLVEFIVAESARYASWMPRLRAFRQYYERNNRTISENVSIKLKSMITKKQIALRSDVNGPRQISQLDLKAELEEFRSKQERIYTLGALINTQIDILEAVTIRPVEK